MAGRIRTLKPELLEDDATASLDSTEWRVFISLLLLADDYGNFRANPKQLDGAIFWALEEEERDWAFIRARLAKLVLFWEVDGQLYGHIRTWARHQRVDKPGKARCPAPPQAELDRPIPPVPSRRQNRQQTGRKSTIREGLDESSRIPRESLANLSDIGAEIPGGRIPQSGRSVGEIENSRESRESLATDLRPPTSDRRPPTSDARDGGGGLERQVLDDLRAELGPRFGELRDPAGFVLQALSKARVADRPVDRRAVIRHAARMSAKAGKVNNLAALVLHHVEELREEGVLETLQSLESAVSETRPTGTELGTGGIPRTSRVMKVF